MAEKVDGIFCKYCGSKDIIVDYSECVDGDEGWESRNEVWICKDCGMAMKVSTEWKMTNFCFQDDRTGEWEDKEYDIKEE